MLLLTGPPGSGKTYHILNQLREGLSSGGDDVRLLAPTATMAEHLRNEMAREGFVFRPSRIMTLYKFIESWVDDLPQVSPATLQILVEESLERVAPKEFQHVLSLSGFQVALAGLIDELSSAGCDSGHCPQLSEAEFGGAIEAVFRDVKASLDRHKLALRSGRLRRAATRIQSQGIGAVRNVLLDGFFSFTDLELALIASLRSHADVTVTLPSWQGAEAARKALLAMGFSETRCYPVRSRPRAVIFTAPTLDQEADDIARRILAAASQGRAFREMGVVVRSEEPYVPALRRALARFDIPARFYFATPLADSAPVRRLARVIDAMLAGWDHEETLAALRMAGATSALDEFEFRVREQLPGRGLKGLERLTHDHGLKTLIESLARMDSWREISASPGHWASTLKKLRSLFPPPAISDGATHAKTGLWRAEAAALDAFEGAMEETAGLFDGEDNVALADFWEAAQTVLRVASLRVPDHRRNVVHVLDVYEARQWELPVVFLCGLLEKEFPRYHSQNPLLSDEARGRLQSAGFRVRTAAEWEQEEGFLFELATSRATELLVLSYPRFNARGDENLPSFLLESFRAALAAEEQTSSPARPRPARARSPEPRPRIYQEDLRKLLCRQHATLAPTAIESFLQCPFQFFGRHTLALKGPPGRPEERLDMLLEGKIVHKVLSELHSAPLLLDSLFDAAFREACERKRIPSGYRTEAVRLELLRNLRGFVSERPLLKSLETRTELEFTVPIDPALSIHGRIDRLDILQGRLALIIDYKYSRSDRIDQNVKANREGFLVQAGLYMLAARRQFDYKPAGMLYCGLRQHVSWNGWHIVLGGLEKLGESCTPDVLDGLMSLATEQSVRAADEIGQGRIVPSPADPEKCAFCDFCDVCRVESAAPATVAGGLLG